MAATLVAHTSQVGTSGAVTTTSGIDTTGATFLIVLVASNNVSTGLTDSKGNTWQLITAIQANPTMSVFVSIPTSVGSGHTFSNTGGLFAAVVVQAWSGISGFGFPTNTNSGGTIATASLAAVGATTSSSLFISGLACDGTASATISSAFTISDMQAGAAAQSFGGGLAYKSSTGPEAPTWTRSSGSGPNAAFTLCCGITGSAAGYLPVN